MTAPRSPSCKSPPAKATAGSRSRIVSRPRCGIAKCGCLDEGPDEWVAEVPGTIKPMQTVDIRWPAFRASDQPMPAYVGQNRTHFIVDCTRDDTDDRLSAGLSF
jgi:hypothetical protein